MRQTPLHALHEEHGANLVDFAGWHMPVQYGPILEEVQRVRTNCGLFDLSHMGRFRVSGPDAVALVDRTTTNHCAKIPVGSIRYALLLNDAGFPLDDLLVYREPEDVYLVVNASNAERDLAWMRDHIGDLDATVTDLTDEEAMIALQGPRSTELLQRVTEGLELAELKYYRFDFGTVCGIEDVRVSRTGYTGEIGYEVYLPAGEAARVWREVLAAGADADLVPIGLGARDTLRLEAGMALYGHEIDEEHDPLEAGLDFAISFDEEKGDWVGREALLARRESPERRLVGIRTDGKRPPRQGYALFAGDTEVGSICSGSISPTLDTKIGTAYVRLGHDAAGTELEMDLRGRRQPVTVQELPFYSRTRKKKSD